MNEITSTPNFVMGVIQLTYNVIWNDEPSCLSKLLRAGASKATHNGDWPICLEPNSTEMIHRTIFARSEL